MTGTFSDISRQKAIAAELLAEKSKVESYAREQRNLLSLFDKGSSILFKWRNDESGNMDYVSESIKRLTGYDPEDFTLGRIQFDSLVHEEDSERVDEELESAKRQALDYFRHTPYRIRTADGELRWVLEYTVAQKEESGVITHFIGYCNDITDQVEAAEKLREAKEQADQANRAKSEFLANMSHEIRTPLNAIIGLTDLTLRKAKNKQVTENLSRVLYSSKLLLTVINDILDYSKIDAGKLNIVEETFELENLMMDSANLFAQEIWGKGLGLILDMDPTAPKALIGDELRISQVCNNLLSNAIKFTSEGEILFGVKCLKKDEAQAKIRIYVKDTGSGIAEENLAHLFDAFAQEDSTITRRFGGTGLGLTICRHLIEMMGGEISVESRLGEGSTFSIDLSLRMDLSKPQQHKLSMEGSRVLVVDDHDTECAIITGMLKSWNAEVRATTNPVEALEWMGKTSFDYVVTDWMMPQMSGTEFVAKMQAKHDKAFPPVIMVSAYDEVDLKASIASKSIKVKSILRKPFTVSQLFDALMGSMEGSAQRLDYPTKVLSQFKGRVLLAEDNEINQQVAKGYLEEFGCEVALAKDGVEAVAMATEQRYDLILMDLHMPRLDGYAATEQIRQHRADIPIVALSAAVMSEDKERSRLASMNGHLAKPIHVSSLERMLETYLNKTGETKARKEEEYELYEIEGIDMQALVRELNQKSRVIKMLRGFVRSFGGVRRELDPSGDMEELRGRLHNLSGVSGLLKMEGICQESRRLEALEDDDLLRSELPGLIDAIEALSAAIGEYLKGEKEQQPQMSMGKPEAIGVLQSVLEPMEMGEVLSDQRQEQCVAAVGALADLDTAMRLRDHLEIFEHEESAQLIREVLKVSQAND